MHKHLRLTCYALLCLLVPIGVMAQTEHTYLDRALPGSWSEEGSDFQQTLPVEDNWWRNFKDPLLDSLIEVAVKQNYSVRMAMDRIAMAKANLRSAQGSYSPTLGLSAGWTRQQSSGNINQVPKAITQYSSATVDMNWEEIMPKIYSAQHTLPFARKAAPVVTVLRTVFWPISSLLVRSSFFINRFSQKRKVRNLSVNELSQALELTDIQETPEENNMLEGIIRFGEETAKEVMTSRLDIVDLEIHSTFSEVLKCINENGYSRIPVYEETRDHIKGILYIKDLLPYLDKGEDFKWQNLIRSALFVPENKMIGDLLRDFQTNKIHIAVVVDEFGGTSGIVTMEDIIEEIVGEINDEYDEEERTYVKLTENVYVFEGKTLLSDFYKIIKDSEEVFEDVSGDADSLAGLLLELKGEFPVLHEIINYQNYRFEILEMTSRRIQKVKVTILPVAQEEDEVKEK